MSQDSSSQETRRPDRAALVIAAILAIAAVGIFFSTMHHGGTAGYSPVGPKTVPYVIAIALVALAIFTAIAAFRGDFPAREPINWPPTIWLIAGMILQMLTMKTVGFSIATGLLFACAARGFGKTNFLVTIPAGIVFSFIVWLIFAKGLQLSLPVGWIERFF